MKHIASYFAVLMFCVFVSGCSTQRRADPASKAFGYTIQPKKTASKKEKEKVSIADVIVDTTIETIKENVDRKNGATKQNPPGIL